MTSSGESTYCLKRERGKRLIDEAEKVAAKKKPSISEQELTLQPSAKEKKAAESFVMEGNFTT